MRGRKPIPTALKKLAGNPGKRPLPTAEPLPPAVVPGCPLHIQGEARREWRRISKQLGRLGLLTRVDRAALAGYCQLWARWVEAEENVRKHGVLVKTPSGYPVLSPYLVIANKAMDLLMKVLVEFGMTPSSRSRVHPAPSDAPDEFERQAFSGSTNSPENAVGQEPSRWRPGQGNAKTVQ